MAYGVFQEDLTAAKATIGFSEDMDELYYSMTFFFLEDFPFRSGNHLIRNGPVHWVPAILPIPCSEPDFDVCGFAATV